MTRLISSVAPMQVEFTASGAVRGYGGTTSTFIRNKTLVPNHIQPRITESQASGSYFLPNFGQCARNGDVIITAVDSGSVCWRSTDGGITFGMVGVGSNDYGRRFCYAGNNTFLGTGYADAFVTRSVDNGASWFQSNPAGITVRRYLDFCNGYVLVTQEGSTTAARSADRGATWTTITLPIAVGPCKTLNNKMTIWTGTNIARATSDDLSTWETATTPTNVNSLAYGTRNGIGKYMYLTTSPSWEAYESYDFQNWRRVFSSGNTQSTPLTFDKWSQFFVAIGAYGWDSLNGRLPVPGNPTLHPCSNEENSVMVYDTTGDGTATTIALIKEQIYRTITY